MKQYCKFSSQIVYFSFIVCCVFFINACEQDATVNYTLTATWQPLDTNIQPISTDFNLTVNGVDESQNDITPTNTINGTSGDDELGGSHGSDTLNGGDDVISLLKAVQATVSATEFINIQESHSTSELMKVA